MFPALLAAAALIVPTSAFDQAFAGRDGTLVLIDVTTGATQRHNPALAATPFAPCSTFKIWNTAIGLENGLLTRADQPFWKWDGVTRGISDWNRDLNLREAFAASCVPAYQALARRIGPARMKAALHKLGYGNEDTTAGIDVFWLPAPGRKPLLISADEQARLMLRLATGDVPFSKNTQSILREIMVVKPTALGTLYGKTGSSGDSVSPPIGWFVGIIITPARTIAIACLLTGSGVSGLVARDLVARLLTREELL